MSVLSTMVRERQIWAEQSVRAAARHRRMSRLYSNGTWLAVLALAAIYPDRVMGLWRVVAGLVAR